MSRGLQYFEYQSLGVKYHGTRRRAARRNATNSPLITGGRQFNHYTLSRGKKWIALQLATIAPL